MLEEIACVLGNLYSTYPAVHAQVEVYGNSLAHLLKDFYSAHERLSYNVLAAGVNAVAGGSILAAMGGSCEVVHHSLSGEVSVLTPAVVGATLAIVSGAPQRYHTGRIN